MKGGIGGGLPGPAEEFREGLDEEQRLVPRRPSDPAADAHSLSKNQLIDFVEHYETLRARCDELQETLNNLKIHQDQRLDAAENHAAMTEGQFAQVWQALRTIDANQQAFNARLAAVAQQIVRNSRKDALDAATRSRQPGEGPLSVLKHADAYALWLEPPTPPVPAPDDQPETEIADGRSNLTSH